VREADADLLIAARTAVHLGGAGAGDVAHVPLLAVGAVLDGLDFAATVFRVGDARR